MDDGAIGGAIMDDFVWGSKPIGGKHSITASVENGWGDDEDELFGELEEKCDEKFK